MKRFSSSWTGCGLILLSVFLFAATAAGQLTVNPSAVNFGSVPVGNSVSQSVAVSNSGTSNLTISQATVSGNGFSNSGLSLPLTLAPGQGASLTATFKAQASGSTSGSLSLAYSVPKTKAHGRNSGFWNGSATVPLAGAGTSAGQLTANPTSLNFANVQTGSSQTQPATLTNSGSGSLTVSQATLNNANFTVSGLVLPLTLAAGQSTAFSVVFAAPQSAGSVSGNLIFTSDASNSTVNIALSGNTVLPGQLTANPASLGFGSVQSGSSLTLTDSLTNTGGSSITITQAAVNNASFKVNGLVFPLTLAPGQSTPFSVVFTAPQSAGSVSGNLTFTSNASNSPMTLALSGNAVLPGQLTANPASLGFGSVQSGSSLTLTDSLTNTGGASVTISQATASGAGFSLMNWPNTPFTLNPGASVTFSVVFTPQSAGNASGSISVNSNASNPTLTISLSGTTTAQGQLTLTPTALNFLSVTVGATATQPGSLSAGGASVTVSSASLSNGEFSLGKISLPVTIAAGQSVPFTVTFAPQASGVANATLSFTSNASNSPTETLSGTGVTPPQHSVSLSWADSGSGIVSYNVYRGGASGGPYTQISSGLASPAYNDTSVVAGQAYYYVATAVDGTGTESVYSNEAQAVIPTP